MTVLPPAGAPPWRRPAGLAASALAATLPLPLILPRPVLDRLFAETGIVETGSVLVYVTLALVAGLARPRRGGEPAIALAGLVLAARELDVNRRFTTMNVEKCATLCFFMAAKVPWSEKLIVGALLLALLAFTTQALRRWGPVFLAALRDRAAPAVTTVVALATMVVSQVLDESAHGLRHQGWRRLADYPWVGAEILELIGPMLLVVATLQRGARPGAVAPVPTSHP